MSIKAMNSVWDLELPAIINNIEIKGRHKFILLAYADHADHEGKNIWPAVATISKKCGVDERTVQRITDDLENCGLLIEDGTGPRGTNRWRMPLKGDKLSPVSKRHGDTNPESLDDNPSGDNPSGDNLSPELKEPEPLDIYKGDAVKILESVAIHALAASKKAWPTMLMRIKDHDVSVVIQDRTIIVSGLTRLLGEGKGRAVEAQVWEDRYGASFKRAELGTGYKVEFCEGYSVKDK